MPLNLRPRAVATATSAAAAAMPRRGHSASSSWFGSLFGFEETATGSAEGYRETQAQFEVAADPDGAAGAVLLRSKVNGRSFKAGRFSCPSLDELRAAGAATAKAGKLQLRHIACGDVLEMHALPEYRGCLFQVASQFNCLEMVGPSVTPEDGVTGYASDRTQGPACSLAAAAATVYRNYFAPMPGGQVGQTAARQVDNLGGVGEAVGNTNGKFWRVRNGYTQSDRQRLKGLNAELQARSASEEAGGREALLGRLRVGLHQDVGVQFARRCVRGRMAQRVQRPGPTAMHEFSVNCRRAAAGRADEPRLAPSALLWHPCSC
eukprot:SAG22_NODE_143_length_17909_cov_34.254969_7_plen_320_part_00